MGTSLRDRINGELKEAMKSQAKRRISTLRLIAAAIKDRDIQNRGAGKGDQTSDQEGREVLAKMVKQRRDSIEAFEKGGRTDLADAEREEIAIIEEFLPRQMGEAEMREAVKAAMADAGCGGLKDMGRVMAVLKERHAGQMDMSRASGLVKELLK
ncbi:MAG: GatB/YqeY domain-containing protein [Parvibaculaceae bacterium]